MAQERMVSAALSAKQLGYAKAVLQAGRDLGITPKGIVIGFATVFVEANWLIWANPKVPASMSIPQDAVGSDGYSVGLFQQQVRQGVDGDWWWGDAATCMDPYKSARLFFSRLAKINYNSDAHTPGSYAQDVQHSAYPDRYDQRIADAQAFYNQLTSEGNTVTNQPAYNEYPKWCANNQSRAGTKVDLWLLHTEEGQGSADDLANFLISTTGGPNPVSYHYAISQDANGAVTVVDCVDTDEASWSVMNSNDRSINACFAGSFASWSRQQWLDNAGNAIDVAAYLAVQDCRKYGIATNVIPGPQYPSDPPGISDHRYCTDHLHDGNNHTDVGDNFPWDVFAAAVAKYARTAAPAAGASPAPIDLFQLSDADKLSNILAQTRGRWAMLGGHTVVEVLAELRDHITGSKDAGKAGFGW